MKQNLIALITILFLSNAYAQKRDFKISKEGDLIPLSKDSILDLRYDKHLQIKKISNPTKFDENYQGYYKEEVFPDFPNEMMGQDFNYLQFQKVGKITYALAKNSFGFWLIEQNKNSEKPYFLGIAKDRFLHIKLSKKYDLIKNGFVQLEASIIRKIYPESAPYGEPIYEALKDNLLIKLDLREVKNDSDQDGYNDLFEQFAGLNPNSKDSDGDGINDFDDKNPLYKSIDNEYTKPFNIFLNGGYTDIISFKGQDQKIFRKEKEVDTNPYEFKVFFVENNNLKNISPKSYKTFIFSEDDKNSNNIELRKVDFYNINIIENSNKFRIFNSFTNGSSSFEIYNSEEGWIVILTGAIVS